MNNMLSDNTIDKIIKWYKIIGITFFTIIFIVTAIDIFKNFIIV